MKRKIISTLLCVSLLIVAFALTISAIDSEPDYSNATGSPYFQDWWGQNREHNCQGSGCQACSTYSGGYYDGALDGYETGYADASDVYKNYLSPEANQESINAAINDYKNTDEYKAEFESAVTNALNEYLNSAEFVSYITAEKDSAVNQYKESDEYKDTLQENYNVGAEAGTSAGYQLALDENYTLIYDKGYTDGQAQFRSTELYKNELSTYFQNGYTQGCLDGYADGVAASGNATEKTSGLNIYTLIVILAVICFIAFVVTFTAVKFKRKRGKRK